MKLGFVSAILPDLNLEQVIQFAAAEGFAAVELMCWPKRKAERKFGGVTHIDVDGLTRTQADAVNGLCAQYGVAISGLGYYPNPLDPDLAVSRAVCAHLRKVILAAERLGLKDVNSFVGRDWTQSVDANWPRFLETWKPLIDDTTRGWWTSAGGATAPATPRRCAGSGTSAAATSASPTTARYTGPSSARWWLRWRTPRSFDQDVLGLGSEARMNLPGRPTGNWRWRFRADDLEAELRDRLGLLTIAPPGRMR